MKTAAALLLIWSVAAGQEPSHPFTVVVLPAAIRDSMSVIWSESNRHWDDVPDMNAITPLRSSEKPTRAYLGCLTGYAAGDTLWVRHLAPAAGLMHRRFSVTGDCSKVPDVIGRWHTHPYRLGFHGHTIKERGLSGSDFKTFAAAADLLTIVMWDADSLDLATKRPEGKVRHPVPYIIR